MRTRRSQKISVLKPSLFFFYITLSKELMKVFTCMYKVGQQRNCNSRRHSQQPLKLIMWHQINSLSSSNKSNLLSHLFNKIPKYTNPKSQRYLRQTQTSCNQ